MSWRNFTRRRLTPDSSAVWPWLLAATTVSFLWLLLGLLWAPIIGPHYTARLYVAYINLTATAVIAVAWMFVRRPSRRLALVSVCAVALDWMWVLIVTSAV